MKKVLFTALVAIFFISCNNAEQNSASGTSKDSTGDTRGEKGTGVDNNGGTPGAGTLTDTSKGKVDTLDHTSKKGKQ